MNKEIQKKHIIDLIYTLSDKDIKREIRHLERIVVAKSAQVDSRPNAA